MATRDPASAASGSASLSQANEVGIKATVEALLRDYDAFLFDCDGTLYHAGSVLPHVPDAIAYLRSLGKKVFFVTNTSSRSREQLQEKLQKLGVPCEAHECVPSGVFTAAYIRSKHPTARRVYTIGGQGLVDELAKVGIESVGGPSEDRSEFRDTDFEAMAESVGKEHYDGVVVGWDTALNYYKIVMSSLVFQKHGRCFFLCHERRPCGSCRQFLVAGQRLFAAFSGGGVRGMLTGTEEPRRPVWRRGVLFR